MPRYAIVARFYLDVDSEHREVAEQTVKKYLEELGALHLIDNSLSVDALLVGDEAPKTWTEEKRKRRERYLKRKHERDEAHRENRG